MLKFSENIRFEGYLRPQGSVTAHLRTQEKLVRDGTGGRVDGTRGVEKSKVLQEVLADLKSLAQCMNPDCKS